MTSPAGSTAPSTPIKVIDLFSGAGGFSAGFHAFTPPGGDASPFETVAAVEFDPAAASTFAANFPATNVYPGDITDWDPGEFQDAEVIMGGPPCQGFSGLGDEKPDDPRNFLWEEYKRVVEKVKPKVFVLENVDRFLRSRQFADLEAATRGIGELGNYDLRYKVLNSADYGVPQTRRRAIVIGTHREFRRDLPLISHPNPTHARPPKGRQTSFGDASDDGILKPWRTVESVFTRSEKLAITDVNLPQRPGSDKSPLGLGQPGPYSVAELHIGRTPTALSRERYRKIPPGGNRHDLRGKWGRVNGESVYLSTASWDKHNSGSGDVMGRLHLDKPSVTIRTEFYKPEKGRYLHPTENRPITHYEAALIQGFPTDFKWYGSKVQIARQIGNAVPAGLSRAIAEVVYRALRGSGEAESV